MILRDKLFLLAPGFVDRERCEYCPECAEIWGLLAYFPALRDSLDICYMPLEKPRADMVALLGEANQNCPTLVLTEKSPGALGPAPINITITATTRAPAIASILTANGHRFLNNARDIGIYYAHRFGTPYPRG